MNVSACLVTRGDVDMAPVVDSLTAAGIQDIVIWNNADRQDLSVYGRYAAIDEAKHDLIYVQDDDVVLPVASIEELVAWAGGSCWSLVMNMPERFRSDFYRDHALVGFGAVFSRDQARAAFREFSELLWRNAASSDVVAIDHFRRTCDVVFTAFAIHGHLVDVPYTDREFASAPNRMWKQPDHVGERQRMLELALRVRDKMAP